MAQVVTVEKNKPLKPNLAGSTSKRNRPPLFRKLNYIFMILGVLFIAIGYICLVGGAPDSPENFNEEVFNVRRIVVSPLLILIGLVVEIFAIMYHPRQKSKDTDSTAIDNN